MRNFPARTEPLDRDLPEQPDSVDGDGPHRPPSWRTLLRHRWVIVTCTVVALALAAWYTRHVVPVYAATSTLRIEQIESTLPDAFRTLSMPVSWLPTEIEELRSRSLAADVVTELGLRLTVVEPKEIHRSDLLDDIKVSDSAPAGYFRLVPSGGRVALLDHATNAQLALLGAENRLEYAGFSFEVGTSALPAKGIVFAILDSRVAAADMAGRVSVGQPSRDVNIVSVSYSSEDPELAWRVPQALVTRYMAQRQQRQSLQLRSTIDYLEGQIATIATQLADAEQKLESYRERFEVIDPQTEAKSQVTRLVSMQTERGMLQDERNSLSALLSEVDAAAASRRAGQASAYRRLFAFPKLLETDAASGLLQSLTRAEDERKELLTRRTSEDEDVLALDQRVGELERELRGMAATYHQSLTSQIQSLDSSLAAFRRQLQAIPEKELQYARLEREPKVLEGVYTMLQTRLKEAEVAVAAQDPSVRIVDNATRPLGPISPRPALNMLAGLMLGLLGGFGIAFAREYFDRAVRTRLDVRGATGLPVIGLIPRINGRGSRVPLIAQPRRALVAQEPPSAAAKRQIPTQSVYTFLSSGGSATPPAPTESPPSAGAGPLAPERTALTISPKSGLIAEALAMLQTHIAFSSTAPAKVLVFTSPLSGDGKTTTVVNLALALAQRGVRVLLIDADVRRGQVHSLFRGLRDPGLAEVLLGYTTFERARRGLVVGERGVMDFLTTGKPYPAEHGLVGSEAMRDLLARAREEYDLVIIDTPPVNVITDAAVLGANADGVILVARVGVTEGAALTYAAEQLRHVRAPLLGVVLNDIDLRRDPAYDSSYKYFRAYEYDTSDT